MTVICDNGDHDGHREPATVRIYAERRPTAARCQCCAEGMTAALMRGGANFSVAPIEQRQADPDNEIESGSGSAR